MSKRILVLRQIGNRDHLHLKIVEGDSSPVYEEEIPVSILTQEDSASQVPFMDDEFRILCSFVDSFYEKGSDTIFVIWYDDDALRSCGFQLVAAQATGQKGLVMLDGQVVTNGRAVLSHIDVMWDLIDITRTAAFELVVTHAEEALNRANTLSTV